MNQKNESFLSLYRQELMGLAAVGIIATHSCHVVCWPDAVVHILAYGGIGVYIFMFLSGIGLYYSLNSRGGYSKEEFYVRRIRTVFVPYLIIAGIWYSIKYILIGRNVLTFFYELSTISFWIEHRGAWYIAALIPFYGLFPFYYDWIQKGKAWLKSLTLIVIIIVVETIIYNCSSEAMNHLSQVLNSLWVFILGGCYGSSVKEKGSNTIGIIPSFAIIFIVEKVTSINKFVPVEAILYAMKGVVFTVIMAYCLHIFRILILHRALSYYGSFSLELYLTNIYLIDALAVFGIGIQLTEYFGTPMDGYIGYIL